MMIKSVNVSSEPDMLILNSQKVIAVVKVSDAQFIFDTAVFNLDL